MRRLILILTAIAGVAAASFVLTTAPGGAERPAALLATAAGRVNIGGEQVIVEIVVVVPPGADAAAEAREALVRAYPEVQPLDVESSGYVTNGLVWDVLPVSVEYNDAGASIGGARNELLAAMQTWTDVETSSFAFSDGGTTTRCPSLVKECPGQQKFDSHNDVGWLDISGATTLGVTWYSTSRDEFDMAIDNANFNWVNGCTANYSLQTVYLHELGHGLGLGHSSEAAAVMYAYYGGPRCALHQDDINGVTAIYPGSSAGPTSTPTISATPTATATPGAEPTATPTTCPPGQARKGRC